MLPRNHTQAQYDATRARLGLDLPLHIQYGRFIVNAVHGDLGTSYVHSVPAVDLILGKLPATLELATAAMLFAICLAFPLGMLAAMRPHGILARVILTGSLLGISMPTFFIGLMFIFLFAVLPNILGVEWLPSMPAGGRGECVAILGLRFSFLTLDGIRHLAMPAMTLGLYYLAVLLRLIRGEMIQELNEDYVRVARAKGLSEASVTVKHALRNALIPVVTVMGMQFGGLIAFSLVTETIFQWPGMGKLLIDSIGLNDQPVVMAYLLLVAVIFVTINLVVDLLYTVIDPRVRVQA
ncbi:ABC transporter permease [Candidatus Sumerlaeota bacterium]|nr:ABC transporter permease [Candidatus Sumerlaeota bacterium]